MAFQYSVEAIVLVVDFVIEFNGRDYFNKLKYLKVPYLVAKRMEGFPKNG